MQRVRRGGTYGGGLIGQEGEGRIIRAAPRAVGAPLVSHHADQWLHGSAQVIGHVEQTADAATWRWRGSKYGNVNDRVHLQRYNYVYEPDAG